jgi:hypothetical protein
MVASWQSAIPQSPMACSVKTISHDHTSELDTIPKSHCYHNCQRVHCLQTGLSTQEPLESSVKYYSTGIHRFKARGQSSVVETPGCRQGLCCPRTTKNSTIITFTCHRHIHNRCTNCSKTLHMSRPFDGLDPSRGHSRYSPNLHMPLSTRLHNDSTHIDKLSLH